MKPTTLVYLYRRRLRAHLAQELLAGLGVAIAVALLFAVTVADGSIASSATEVMHAVIGPANLQLRARGSGGFDEGVLARVEALPGVKQAAPLLEQSASVVGPDGRRAAVQIAGTELSLALLDGLAHTIPLSTISSNGIGLSSHTAGLIGDPHRVALELRGRVTSLHVTAVLDDATFGAPASAPVAVMGLARLQALAGLPGKVTRILVETKPGREAEVRTQLRALAGTETAVGPADEEDALLHQALRPTDQSSDFFAAICALLGFLFAFNAILLTVPERRHAIADLRLLGARRAQVVQIVIFQALCLGLAASLVGLLAGYALCGRAVSSIAGLPRRGVHARHAHRDRYGAAGAGARRRDLATCLASALTLLEVRGGRALDTAHSADGASGNALGRRAQLGLTLAAGGVLALASATFALWSSLSLAALWRSRWCACLRSHSHSASCWEPPRALVARRQQLTLLPVALISLRGATLRSLALATTGAVALFGSGALGGARADLRQGIGGFTRSYTADASIWVNPPGATRGPLISCPATMSRRSPACPGSAPSAPSSAATSTSTVAACGSSPARPAARANCCAPRSLLRLGRRERAARRGRSDRRLTADRRRASRRRRRQPDAADPQRERPLCGRRDHDHARLGPGVIFMSAADYQRYWQTTAPTALGVQLAPGATSRVCARRSCARSGGRRGPEAGWKSRPRRCARASSTRSPTPGSAGSGRSRRCSRSPRSSRWRPRSPRRSGNGAWHWPSCG